VTCLAQDTESEQTEKQNSVLAVVSRHYKLTLLNVRKYASLDIACAHIFRRNPIIMTIIELITKLLKMNGVYFENF
jgi:hypothetical protein